MSSFSLDIPILNRSANKGLNFMTSPDVLNSCDSIRH